MDWMIKSEKEENNRVLQNLKVAMDDNNLAMDDNNLAMMRKAKKELDARYDVYDTLSNEVVLVPGLRSTRVVEWYRFVKAYNVLKSRYRQLHDSLYEEKRRNALRSSLLQLPGEDLRTYYLRLTQKGSGFKNLDRALLAVAAEERRLKGLAPPPNPDKWECSGCDHMNPKKAGKCTMCGKSKPNKFQMLKKSKRKSSRKRKASRKRSRKRRSAKRKRSRKRRSAKRKTSRKRKSSKRKASRKRSRKRRSSKRCPTGCVKKKTSKRKSRKVKKS